MSSGIDGALIRDVFLGVAALLAGVGVFIVCSALARTLARLNKTLDEVDVQVAALSAPLVQTLGHVGGIADTADATVARLGQVVGTLEGVAGGVGNTAKLASDAVAPALVNVGATLTGITAGLRRLVSGRRGSAPANGASGGTLSGTETGNG
ncbi:MAG: hypothetical protein QOJ39_3532 [Candidatus Eremiobacteraeota bacterium]|nr:hypothetical protein [Candidatus Eremiobacteraeota bacterium]